ncbi:MAG: GntR family transcriptional regulator [Tissierellia bacterium]|nr:GntR family transcriptional regulator [Tissierellia bacterium]
MDKLKRSLSKSVYLQLKDKILNNELLPGDRLVEMNIAKELEVSRTPVREALRELEADGLVVNFPRKGYIVSKISVSESLNLYEVRFALEPRALESLASTITDEGIAELRSIVSQLEEANKRSDYPMMELLMVEWNRKIITLLDNSVMKEVISMINNRLYRLANYIFRDLDNFAIVYNFIIQVFQALEERRGKDAYRISKENINTLCHLLEKQTDYRMFRK